MPASHDLCCNGCDAVRPTAREFCHDCGEVTDSYMLPIDPEYVGYLFDRMPVINLAARLDAIAARRAVEFGTVA